MAAAQLATATFDVGSTSIVPVDARGTAGPGGTLHLVDGWEPLCGGERVRFVFPGRDVDAGAACPQCAAAATPRQRSSAAGRTTARRTTPARARATAS
jgi:hypothetical protein